jgi:hypothetical protein
MPQFSPDGKQISFVTTHGKTGIIAPRGLAVAPSAGGDPSRVRGYPMNGAWMSEIVWAPDSQSLFVTMNEGTFAAGAQMFDSRSFAPISPAVRRKRVVGRPSTNAEPQRTARHGVSRGRGATRRCRRSTSAAAEADVDQRQPRPRELRAR